MPASASPNVEMKHGDVGQPSTELLQRIADYPNLPTPSHVAMKIIELLKDQDADFNVLMDSLAQDPALVARILKTANSATYARRREVTNLGQALLTLGQAATTTLALSFSLVGSMQDSAAEAPHLDLGFFWQRSMLAGFVAKSLGVALKSDRCEELFLSGLLQDIGLMVLGMAVPDTYEVVADRISEHEALIQREVDLHEVDHAWIGAWLLERWGLPNIICEAVRHSHTLAVESGDPELKELYSCVALSGKIADVMLTNPTDAGIAGLALDMADNLELEHEQILSVLNKIGAEIPELESQFGMSVLDAEQTAEIVGRARGILTDFSMQLLQEITDLQSRAENLEEANSRDALTGLYNREKMDEELDCWVARATKHGFPLALAFMDLDGFKSVNDTYGHPAGDAALRNTAELLTKQIRSTDALARYGGDEFVLLLGGENKSGALVVCKRILAAFENATPTADGEALGLHISIGLVTLNMISEVTPAEFVRAADEALLKAKAKGKAQVICYDDLEAG